jgi:hypothetical protein
MVFQGWHEQRNATTVRGLLGFLVVRIRASKAICYASPLNCESHSCKTASWSSSTLRKATPIPMLRKTEATLPRAVNVSLHERF